MTTIGLFGGNFAGLDLFISGIKRELPSRILWLDSGSIRPYLHLVDAVIYLHDEARDQIEEIRGAGKPMLARSVPFLELGVPVLHMDDEAPARQLGDAMIRNGARRFLYWGVPKLFSERRRNGLAAAAMAAGFAVKETFSLEETVEAAAAGGERCGVLCMNDERAFQVTECLSSRGLGVPKDVLIAGYDNRPTPDAPWAVPTSTVVLPIQEQGEVAGRLLKAWSPDKPIPVGLHFTRQPRVLLRQSTGNSQ